MQRSVTGFGLDVSGHGNGFAAGKINNDGFTGIPTAEYDRVQLFLNCDRRAEARRLVQQALGIGPGVCRAKAMLPRMEAGWQAGHLSKVQCQKSKVDFGHLSGTRLE